METSMRSLTNTSEWLKNYANQFGKPWYFFNLKKSFLKSEVIFEGILKGYNQYNHLDIIRPCLHFLSDSKVLEITNVEGMRTPMTWSFLEYRWNPQGRKLGRWSMTRVRGYSVPLHYLETTQGLANTPPSARRHWALPENKEDIRWTDLYNRMCICQDKNTPEASGAGTLTVWASCLSSDFANHLSLNSI